MPPTKNQLEWIENSGCRFPAIAWHSLQKAREIKPSHLQKDRMLLVEYAATSIMASAATIDAQILILAYFVLGAIKEHVGEDEACGYAKTFLAKPYSKPWEPGPKRCVSGARLHKVGRALTRILNVSPPWPNPHRIDAVRDRRNRLVHRTVAPTDRTPVGWNRPYRPSISVELLEDKEPKQLLREAEESFTTMLDCAASLKKAFQHFDNPRWSKRTRDDIRKRNARKVLANLHALL